jgi:carbon monoxide dehydrogenase subunit G
MKTSLITVIAVSLALSLLAPGTASAKFPKLKPTPEPDKVNAAGATIGTVAGDSVTIQTSKKSTTYRVSRDTQVQVDGQRATLANLKPGMHAEVTASSLDPNLLLSISAHSVPKN